jgi:VWFA-related protein
MQKCRWKDLSKESVFICGSLPIRPVMPLEMLENLMSRRKRVDCCRFWLRSFFGLICGLGLTISAPAQYRSDVPLVVVRTTVLDGSGHPVADVPQGSFALFEDGEPQRLIEAHHDDEPISVGIVLDRESMCPLEWEQSKSAAITLIDSLQSGDRVYISAFGGKNMQEVKSGPEVNTLAQAMNHLQFEDDVLIGKALESAVWFLSNRAQASKLALILITDAERIRGSFSEALAKQVSLTNTTIYVINLGPERPNAHQNKRKSTLQAFAQQTGGSVYFTDFTYGSSDSAARQLATELHSGYSLVYSPPNGLDGKYHAVRTQVATSNAVTVRSRQGYYGSVNQLGIAGVRHDEALIESTNGFASGSLVDTRSVQARNEPVEREQVDDGLRKISLGQF